ncbi:uncharacterized protein A4U43_C07F13370 [Asparagus officinalis]|uniref:3'-5' exonuclease domain-containing protein n=1 Tax=Asparagus officinalis TaxID=4686 RepID=A0A5P1EBX9_ASPOF|nr:uncharacterized protein LOC109849927 isoform X2 [Asparagus officinalis]ONK63283.1 uncharacterized protein A4U43_C07F13370 [Asparagus officinalis]
MASVLRETSGAATTRRLNPLNVRMESGRGISISERGKSWTICLHAFADMSHVPPAVFVYLLKECYLSGTRTATQKFKVLQQHVFQALHNAPQPGPATFIVQCLYVVPLLGLPYGEGFSHLLTSSMRRLISRAPESGRNDFPGAKRLATHLFLDILAGAVVHAERILIKILENFEIELKDVGEAICGVDLRTDVLDIAKARIEHYILAFMESESYVTAVTLSEHFSICPSGDFFLLKMMENNQFKPAEKWATLMGKPMVCLVIQKYLDMKMLKSAYEMIKTNNLKQEFPDVHHLYKESLLKKLAEKGCWDIAELRAQKDRQLLKYLVYLALEAGYTEKVKEICDRYTLEGFDEISVSDESSRTSQFLDLSSLILDDIIWVDDINGLLAATNYIEGCKVIGLDCEWKPNIEKGCQPNKVSIMQVASENRAFIFDLIKLYQDEPKALNNCFSRILCSPNILKLGYNLQCDLHQLSHSYGELECFRYYEMLLDIQKLFNERSGGLSGLAQKILGAGLNKTRRNSNWEQRPLSQNQMEYAALDAAVLVHIFRHVRSPPNSPARVEQSKGEWKSHIVSHMGNARQRRLA